MQKTIYLRYYKATCSFCLFLDKCKHLQIYICCSFFHGFFSFWILVYIARYCYVAVITMNEICDIHLVLSHSYIKIIFVQATFVVLYGG